MVCREEELIEVHGILMVDRIGLHWTERAVRAC